MRLTGEVFEKKGNGKLINLCEGKSYRDCDLERKGKKEGPVILLSIFSMRY